MSTFNLPDLGEGLPDAEIHEWFVKVGDTVQLDQPLVAMETAKAVVEVPAPQAGEILELFGKPGDIIKTGSPLVRFSDASKSEDAGTVVGHLEESKENRPDDFVIGTGHASIKTTPSIRLLAKKLQVNLNTIKGTGEHGLITKEDVEKTAKPPEGYEPLHGVRRAMLQSMIESHQHIVPVSIYDEVDIQAWPEHTDLTVRLIRALIQACEAESALNAWFSEQHAARKCFKEVNVGLAMDSAEGLFVPVLKNVAAQSDSSLRDQIESYKKAVADRSLSPDAFKGATITLSNFGKFAGRFASPIIVAPTVAIVGVGRTYLGAAAEKGGLALHRLLPLSLSFDHRAVTGGEATRFLGKMIEALA